MKIKCEVCHQDSHKYKCPTCLVLYCSLNCYKNHKKEDACVKKEKAFCSEISTEKTELLLEDDERLCSEKLELLEKSNELKDILANPHLRTMLTALDSAKNKQAFIETCMQEPIFVEFADKCLSIVR